VKIGVLAGSRFPIREPFAGGLEAHVWSLVRGLRRRGHCVALFAGPGSDPSLEATQLNVRRLRLSRSARADLSMGPREQLEEHHAYLQLMLNLSGCPEGTYDVLHNHSLHYLPIAMAPALPMPLLTTLHTPPTPWLESAIQVQEACPVTFAAVSAHTATAWSHLVPEARVVHNGVDLEQWTPGAGGEALVWFGRIAPEKGTHLALEAARRAKCALRVAGPIVDRSYFAQAVRPLLGGDIHYVGHLTQGQLVRLVGGSRAAVVTPCWDEPYGLVVAEALACGTPICGFARGAVPELIDHSCARLVPAGDVQALADAVGDAGALSRSAARQRAAQNCSLDRMVDAYTALYAELSEVAA